MVTWPKQKSSANKLHRSENGSSSTQKRLNDKSKMKQIINEINIKNTYILRNYKQQYCIRCEISGEWYNPINNVSYRKYPQGQGKLATWTITMTIRYSKQARKSQGRPGQELVQPNWLGKMQSKMQRRRINHDWQHVRQHRVNYYTSIGLIVDSFMLYPWSNMTFEESSSRRKFNPYPQSRYIWWAREKQ